MPLIDHFHAPVYPARSWESFHALWSGTIAARLNREILPKDYFAEIQVHVGGCVEVDVASFHDPSYGEEREAEQGGVALATWAPPKAALSMPAVFPDEFEVQVFDSSGGAILVAAIELVSPGNKDRPEMRRAFAVKCAGYLQRGIGLVIVDIVSSRLANLHDELVGLLEHSDSFRFPEPTPLYAVAYRPFRPEPAVDRTDVWFYPLTLGAALPTLPLALRRGPILPLDLEATYSEARLRSRL